MQVRVTLPIKISRANVRLEGRLFNTEIKREISACDLSNYCWKVAVIVELETRGDPTMLFAPVKRKIRSFVDLRPYSRKILKESFIHTLNKPISSPIPRSEKSARTCSRPQCNYHWPNICGTHTMAIVWSLRSTAPYIIRNGHTTISITPTHLNIRIYRVPIGWHLAQTPPLFGGRYGLSHRGHVTTHVTWSYHTLILKRRENKPQLVLLIAGVLGRLSLKKSENLNSLFEMTC